MRSSDDVRVLCVSLNAQRRMLETAASWRSKRGDQRTALTRVSFLRIKKIINNNGLDQLSERAGEPELELIGEAPFPSPICGDVRGILVGCHGDKREQKL